MSRRPTDSEVRAAIDALTKATEDVRASRTFKVYAYHSIESMRWTLGEAEHPFATLLEEKGR